MKKYTPAEEQALKNTQRVFNEHLVNLCLLFSSRNTSGKILTLYLKGKNTSEIATDCRLSESYVKKMLARNRAHLLHVGTKFTELISIFKHTEFFLMEPTKVLEYIRSLEKQNAELRGVKIAQKPKRLSARDVVLATAIEDVPLSLAAYARLKEYTFDTLGRLTSITRNDLGKYRGIGKKILNEIEAMLKSKELHFAEE